MEREEAALVSAWEQWERSALQTRAGLETTLSQIASSEQEFSSRSVQLEQDLGAFTNQLQEWHLRLSQAEGKNDGEEAVKGWQLAKVRLISFPAMVLNQAAQYGYNSVDGSFFSNKDTLEDLVKAEPTSESLKTQLNDLCRFSKDMAAQSDRVSALIKEYNRSETLRKICYAS